MTGNDNLSSAQVRDRAERRYAAAITLIERLSDLFVINLLWLLCCVTLLPAYAGTAAMYSTIQAWIDGDERPAVRAFRQELHHSWRRATTVGLLWTAAAALLAVDVLVVLQMSGTTQTVVGVGVAVLIAAWLLTTFWLGTALRAGHGGLRAIRVAGGQVLRQPLLTVAALLILGVALLGIAALPVLIVALPAVATFAWCRLGRSVSRDATRHRIDAPTVGVER